MTCPRCSDDHCAQDPAGAYWCQNPECRLVWFPMLPPPDKSLEHYPGLSRPEAERERLRGES